MIRYLATPYSSTEAYVREQRFMQACVIAGQLMGDGFVVYSPIAHSHPIAGLVDLPTSWEFWQTQCVAMLRVSSVLVVAMMDGWQESVGVQAEIALAKELGIPVEYLEIVFTMEPNPQLLTSCLGKTGFVSRGNAEKALRELRRKGRLKHAGPDRADKSKIEIYSCGFCGLYHHGHSKRQSQKLIRSRKADLG